MERKARENLEAARLLANGDDACPNAAVSRAYYAAYQACWTAMVREGVRVPARPAGTYFPHKDLAGEALRRRLLTDEQAEDLEFLENQRVVADYGPDDIVLAAARLRIEEAGRLVELLLGEET